MRTPTRVIPIVLFFAAHACAIPEKAVDTGGQTSAAGDATIKRNPAGSDSPQQDSTGNQVLTLDEAKSYCVGCHIDGGSGARVWRTAGGGLEEWKKFAPFARDSVVGGRMPLAKISDAEKKRLLLFLNGLISQTAAVNSSSGGSGQPAAPLPSTHDPAGAEKDPEGGAAPVVTAIPTPVVAPTHTPSPTTAGPMTHSEAQLMCAGCHGVGNPKWKTGPGTPDDWRPFADALIKSVETDRMPLGFISAETKQRILDYLKSLKEPQPSP